MIISMKIYNSLTRKKETFIPIEKGKVSLYHCGPTVYDYVHIGNLRSFMLGDFLRRTFEYLEYEVKQVMNITDVGHLVSDGDEGDDKMTKALKRKGKEITVENMLSAATQYADAFKNDLRALNVRTPHQIPRASEHIDGNIEMIKKLEKKGYVYQTTDGVYFDTAKMPEYGLLGGVNVDDGETRTGINTEKRQQADFALWKFDEKQGWDSPWGQGFPGWHIECSTMSQAFLGDHFDIHTGGLDNLPIHHNNEIAQSVCATGGDFVNYWMHGAMLNFGGAKLSKSTGGNITLKTLGEKEIDPLVYRYLTLQTHYHSPMNFTWEILSSAEQGLKKIYRDIFSLREESEGEIGMVHETYQKEFKSKIEEDVNLPQALAVFHSMMKDDLQAADMLATAYNFDQVLGLGLQEVEEDVIEVPEDIQVLLGERKKFRDTKDWDNADKIRDTLLEQGYRILDVGEDQKIERI